MACYRTGMSVVKPGVSRCLHGTREDIVELASQIFEQPWSLAKVGRSFTSCDFRTTFQTERCWRGYSMHEMVYTVVRGRYYAILLVRLREPVRVFPLGPDFFFCASPTNSAINPLYVSESWLSASRCCRRYVNKADVSAVRDRMVCSCFSNVGNGSNESVSVIRQSEISVLYMHILDEIYLA